MVLLTYYCGYIDSGTGKLRLTVLFWRLKKVTSSAQRRGKKTIEFHGLSSKFPMMRFPLAKYPMAQQDFSCSRFQCIFNIMCIFLLIEEVLFEGQLFCCLNGPQQDKLE